MAYTSTESGRAEVYVAPFPDGDRRWQVSSGGGLYPRWGPDGKEIFYVGNRNLMVAGFNGDGEVSIDAPELALAVHEHPMSFEEFGSAAYDVAPDGSLVVLHYDEAVDQAVLLVQHWTGLLGEK